MTALQFVKNFIYSYRTFFRLFFKTYFRSRGTQARLSLKRFFIMSGLFPVLFTAQSMHWLGFALDEILFRGYRAVKIQSPVFILGVPRSGTTFLHRLLARDRERFATYSLWEMILAPSVTERKFWLALGRLDSLAGAPFKRLIKRVEKLAFGSLDSIHHISLTEEEEDYFLLLPIYACFLLILPFPFQEELGSLAFFDDRIPPEEQERIMAFYSSCIRRHLFAKGEGKTFLSKNVSFSPMIRALNRTFPDCSIIATVRNPLNAAASHISSMYKGAAVFDNDPRGFEFCSLMVEVQRYAYTHITEALPGIDEARQAMVRMEDLQENLASTVSALYGRLGFEMSAEFAEYIREQDLRQKNYQSAHHYNLSEFGLSEDFIYREFSDAFRRLGYPGPEQRGAAELKIYNAG